MSQYPDVLYEVKDRVAIVTLNRPDRLNAYTGQMADSIKHAISDAANDSNVRVIVLTGAGRGFCAGADMDVLSGHVARGNNASTKTAPGSPLPTRYAKSLEARNRKNVSLARTRSAPAGTTT